jgi:Family of unknown function (DUF6356)
MFHYIRERFLHHPTNVCMTYVSHMRHSLTLSLWFAWASAQALVHAVFPLWCITSSTDNVRSITMYLQNSGCASRTTQDIVQPFSERHDAPEPNHSFGNNFKNFKKKIGKLVGSASIFFLAQKKKKTK